MHLSGCQGLTVCWPQDDTGPGPFDSSDEEDREVDEPFEEHDFQDEAVPLTVMKEHELNLQPGCHWATDTPEMPEDAQLLVVPSFDKTPWAQLSDKANEVRVWSACEKMSAFPFCDVAVMRVAGFIQPDAVRWQGTLCSASRAQAPMQAAAFLIASCRDFPAAYAMGQVVD